MLSRIFEQKRTVPLYLAAISVNFENLSSEERAMAEKRREMLKPFEEITMMVNSSCSSVYLI